MRMPGPALAACLMAGLLGCISGRAQQSAPSSSPAAAETGDEQADLNRAAEEAGMKSPIDFVRSFERFLQKYPKTQVRERIVRSLFAASKDIHDPGRIATYGEQLLEKDPDDVSVLPEVGRALNSFEDLAAAAKALKIGQHLEQLLQQNDKPAESETPRDKGRHKFESARNLNAALVIQADALGELGKPQEAVDLARRAFSIFPSAEAARSLGHWQANAGHYDAAVAAYANAFAISDSTVNHTDDRHRMTEYYLKAHKSESGLGDIVLDAYDRMTAIAERQQEQYGNSTSTKPINFQLSSVNGDRLPLLSLKGKIIVMDFWATWCGPCRQQHPLFEQVKTRFKNDDRIVFLEVDSDENRETVEAFLKNQGWGPGVYMDDGLARALGIDSIPTTILFDRTGEIFSKMVGFRPESFITLLTSRIQDALAAQADTARASAKVN